MNEPKPGDRVLIISPARDEAEYIEQTIHSMAWQDLRPAMWLIVNDGSSDDTGEIADAAAAKHDWIKVLHRPIGTQRQGMQGVIEAFNAGLESVDLNQFDFVAKLDADIHVPHFYFSGLIARFQANPKLGAISGKCYTPVEGQLVYQRSSDETTLGTAKLFRRTCFQEIGGFVQDEMWDGIDSHQCRMHGWEAGSVKDPQYAIIHLRREVALAKLVLHRRRLWGRSQWYMGSHLLYVLAIALKRMAERPRVLGGLNILLGYLWARLIGDPQFSDVEFRKFLKKWQRQKLASTFHPLRRRKKTASHSSFSANPMQPAP